MSVVVSELETMVISESERETVVLTSGPQGPAGPPGPPGGATVTKVAGETLGGHRMVVLDGAGDAYYADSTDLTHVDRVLGMTSGAASLGGSVGIQILGEIIEVSWSWTLNQPIFLSTSGQLTQTAPTTGFSLVVGFPITSTSMVLSIQRAVIL